MNPKPADPALRGVGLEGESSSASLSTSLLPREPRSPSAKRFAQAFSALVVSLQVFFLVRAYHDPHTHFGYQPFNESSTWRAEIYRVTWDGRREAIRDGWEGYRWDELVRERVGAPFALGHADSGVDSTLDFLAKAMDWVADHTPNDRATRYFEAEVEYYRNTRGPTHRLLRSKERPRTGDATGAR